MSEPISLIDCDELDEDEVEEIIEAVNNTEHFTGSYDKVIDCIDIRRESDVLDYDEVSC